MIASDDAREKPEDSIEIDLRQPAVAALLAWLWPGAGHIYQRRYGKGLLFMTCILCTYFLGLSIGRGHVVYASWGENDRRWQYFCQVGVGLPALPALLQNRLVRQGKQPLLNGWIPGFMAPPSHVDPDGNDDLARWHKALSGRFDLGTVYTMIAGLLNILAICDAYAGPFLPAGEKDDKRDGGKPPPDDESS
jgi:hypothetical protein